MIKMGSLDPTLPKAKVEATLPHLNLSLSDDRLTQLAHILHSTSKACEAITTNPEQPFDQARFFFLGK